MRDPKRIESMLNQIRELWEKEPDWRLGQLIVNAIRPTSPCPEVFGIEDRVLQRRIAELTQMVTQQQQQQ